MANDRMIIRNKISGKKVFLAKHYCSGWYIADGKDIKNDLEEFFEESYEEFMKDHHSYEITYEKSINDKCCQDQS